MLSVFLFKSLSNRLNDLIESTTEAKGFGIEQKEEERDEFWQLTAWIDSEDGQKGKDAVEQCAWIGDERLLMIHRQGCDEQLWSRQRTPEDSQCRHTDSKQTPIKCKMS